MFIKICGLTDEKQAKEVSELGATHIGVVFYPKSPRFVDIEKIKKIKDVLPSSVKLVAVVVNPERKDIEELLKVADLIQFHGDESIEFIKKFPKEKIIKAFRMKNEKDIEKIKPFVKEGYTILIDSYKEGEYGGTGKKINTELAKEVSNLTDRFILSGGLSPQNITDLLQEIKPYGVDASSKLEIEPGVKDIRKVKEFIEKAKGYYERNN